MQISEILSRYPVGTVTNHESLGNAGGFSGAALWRIETTTGNYCLRRWPTSMKRSRLHFIHHVLAHLQQNDCSIVPTPIINREGEMTTTFGQSYFELSPWMPGEANYFTSPNEFKLTNAMTTLAQIHIAAATCTRYEEHRGTSDTIAERIQLTREFAANAVQIKQRIAMQSRHELTSRAQVVLDRFQCSADMLESRLRRVADYVVPLQPCIRDVWHDHVLFTDNDVTGVVDFGAMRIESVATDISRLVGSLVTTEKHWQFSIDAYEQTRPLTSHERQLITIFAESFRVLAGMQWLQWIYIDQRTFDDERLVMRRLDAIIDATAPA